MLRLSGPPLALVSAVVLGTCSMSSAILPRAGVASGISVWAVAALPATAATASMDLFHRALNFNPQLRSYIASATLVARMYGPLPIQKTFTGSAWYLKPNLKIVFDNLPSALQSFQELSLSAITFQDPAKYTVTPGADDGVTSVYALVPTNPDARVKQITFRIDDASAQIEEALWAYTNGSTLRVSPSYTMVSGMRVASRHQIIARYPNYRVDGTLTFSNYAINVPIDPNIFASSTPQP
jgi:hypothetical protein